MDNPTPARLCATHNEWCPTGECRWCPVGTVAPVVPPKLESDFSTMSDVGSRMNTTVFYCSQTLFCDAPGLEKVKALADTFSSPLDNPSNDKSCGNKGYGNVCDRSPDHDGCCGASGMEWFEGSPTHRKQLAFKAYPPSDKETGFIPAQVHGGTLCMYPSWKIGDNRWCNRKRHHTGPCGPPDAPFWSASPPPESPVGLDSPMAIMLKSFYAHPQTSAQWTDMVLSEPDRNGDLEEVLAELNKILGDASMSMTGKLNSITEIVKAFSGPDEDVDAGDTPKFRADLADYNRIAADTYGEKP